MTEKLIYIDETTSTNNYLKQLALDENLPEGITVWANFQSAGKGQQGNSWESEAGKNLSFSILLYPHFIDVSRQFVISQIISLAIKTVLDEYIDDVRIKWPNDIYHRGKKICGILIENNLMDGTISQSVIGAGVNLNQEVFLSDAKNPVSLKQITGSEYDRETILRQIIDKLKIFYELAKTDKHSITEKYKDVLYRSDGFYLYEDIGGSFLAEIVDVEDSGFFVLRTDSGSLKKYAFKEVKFL